VNGKGLWSGLLLGLWLLLAGPAAGGPGKVTLTIEDIDIREAMEMLSRSQRVNIVLSDAVRGKVTVNLYDMYVDEAIRAIAAAGGFAVERRHGSYFVVPRAEVGKYAFGGVTRLRTFKVQYTDPRVVAGILKKHLSAYGKITLLPERNLLVVEDRPEFVRRIELLLREVDRRPRQILIEARILEVTLRDSESYGLDWSKLFTASGGDGAVGVQGLAAPGAAGFFVQLANRNLKLLLDTLKARGRLRTLSTPKLLALENQEAQAIIGNRLGYRVTTTINQVTSESVEFLESGVILKVTASVDADDRILLKIHPEVSTGSVSDDGIPSQTTTEVTTQMLVDDGQTVFIGGLIKRSQEESREGVPVLGDVPFMGRLFANRAERHVNTETVVLITPRIVRNAGEMWNVAHTRRVGRVEQALAEDARRMARDMDALAAGRRPEPERAPAAAQPAAHDPWEGLP